MKIGTVDGDLARWFGNAGRLTVQRAISELRAGRPVKLAHGADSLTVVAAEMLGGPRIAEWHAASGGALGLVLPAPRMDHLGIAAAGPTRISLDDLSGDGIDAVLVAVSPIVPAVVYRRADTLEASALELVKRAYLLPAAIVLPAAYDAEIDMIQVAVDAVENFHDQSAHDLTIAARTRVPLADAEDAEFVIFRGGDGLRDQIAIIVGKLDPSRAVLTRLHSACLTGDLFASLKCDCGDQLRLAMREIDVAGGGVLLYLDQEGRGIGLLNKM